MIAAARIMALAAKETQMTRPTVSAGYARALLDFAVSKGADRARLLTRARITAADLADQDSRIPMDRYVTLMRAAKEETGDGALALHFSEGTRLEAFTIVGLISQSAATMGEGLAQLSRYRRLIAEVDVPGGEDRFHLARRDDGLWLEDRRPDPNAFPELTEAAFSRFVCEVRRHHGDLEFVKAVEVTHPRPAHASEYERIFGAPVRFGAERNAMRVVESWLAVPINKPDLYVFGVFIEHAEGLMRRLADRRTVRGQVEGLLAARLHKGAAGMEAIAAAMGMSPQTLYRRLKAEGVRFEAVLDGLRRDLAEGYLSSEKLSVNETAYLLGFSDPSAFSRAYKRWTGTSPKAAKGAP